MAFVKKTWVDRLSEFPGRRLLKRISGSADGEMVVDVERSEGTVSRTGDAFSAANMNDLEQRIGDEFEEVNNNLGGCSLEQNGKEFYIVGADSVRKKLGSATWADVATTNINFSGSVHYAGDRVYSNSLPATYNGKTFLCLYFTSNITGSAINSGYPVTVSPDRSNRRISFYTPVEMPGIVYCTATITGVYV